MSKKTNTIHIDVTALREGFYIFGNKGNVWNNTCHIYQAHIGNLCGTPALSSNWARIWETPQVGCPECIKHYHTLFPKP